MGERRDGGPGSRRSQLITPSSRPSIRCDIVVDFNECIGIEVGLKGELVLRLGLERGKEEEEGVKSGRMGWYEGEKRSVRLGRGSIGRRTESKGGPSLGTNLWFGSDGMARRRSANSTWQHGLDETDPVLYSTSSNERKREREKETRRGAVL